MKRKPAKTTFQPRHELIKISEFQRRVWGENGTPLTAQAIRNQIKRGDLTGEQIGKPWFVDWTAYCRRKGAGSNELVAHVLRRAS